MRYKATAEGMIPFTDEEELEFEAEVAANDARQPKPGKLEKLESRVESLLSLLVTKDAISEQEAIEVKEGKGKLDPGEISNIRGG